MTEHRDDLVRTRTQTANRIHGLLTQIVAARHPRGLTADDAARVLRSVRPRTPLGRTLSRLAVELVGELRRLDRRIAAITEQLADAVTASGTTLTAVYGIDAVVAAKLLARTGPISRFRSTDAFASYAGVAPIECPPATWCAIGCPLPAIDRPLCSQPLDQRGAVSRTVPTPEIPDAWTQQFRSAVASAGDC